MKNHPSKVKFRNYAGLIGILMVLFHSVSSAADSQSNLVHTSTSFDKNSDYVIFTTQYAYGGNFIQEYWWFNRYDYGNAITAEAAADYLCQHDPRNPDSGHQEIKYKALIGTANRYGKSADGVSAKSNDWPLIANKKYYSYYYDNYYWDDYYEGAVFELIFTANSESTFTFGKLDSVFNHEADEAGHNAWTGLTSEWQTNDHTCKGWTTFNSDNEGRVGDLSSIDSNSIDDNKSACGNNKHLICVQQTPR